MLSTCRHPSLASLRSLVCHKHIPTVAPLPDQVQAQASNASYRASHIPCLTRLHRCNEGLTASAGVVSGLLGKHALLS